MLNLSFGRKKRKKAGIGLDIGSKYIKLAVLDRRGSTFELKKYAIEELPAETIVGKEIMDRQAVVEKLAAIVEQHGLEGEAVTFNVAGKGVILRRITVPKQDQKSLAESIERYLTENIPFDLADVIWDYKVLPSSGTEEEMDLLLAAVRNDTVYSLIDIVKESGLQIGGIDIDPISIGHALAVNNYMEGEGDIFVFHMGYENTEVVLFRDGLFYAYRDIPIATKVYSEALMRYLDITFDRTIPVLVGLEVEGEGYEEVLGILRSINERLVEQIDRLFPTLISPDELEKPRAIYLTGGGAWIVGFRDFLQDHYQVAVDIADPLLQLSYDPELFGDEDTQRLSPLLTVAVGLALKQLGNATINLVLSPAEERGVEEKKKIKISLEPVVGILAGAGLAAYMGLTYISQTAKIKELRLEKAQTEGKIAELKKKVKELQIFEERKLEVETKLNVIHEVAKGRFFQIRILDELNRILPEGVWLKDLKEEGDGVNSVSITLDGGAVQPYGVTQLMRSLQDSPIFDNVQLISVSEEKTDEGVYTSFQMKFTAVNMERGINVK